MTLAVTRTQTAPPPLPQDLTVVDLVSLERRVLKTGYAAFTMGVAFSLDGAVVRGGGGGETWVGGRGVVRHIGVQGTRFLKASPTVFF